MKKGTVTKVYLFGRKNILIISELKIGFKRILMPSSTDILVGLSDVF